MADPALSADITELIRDQSLSDDLQIQMLEIVVHGRLEACLDAAVDVVADPTASERLKAFAASSIEALGDQEARRRLARVAKQMPKIPVLLCARIATATFPKVIDAAEFVQLLVKADMGQEHNIDLRATWLLISSRCYRLKRQVLYSRSCSSSRNCRP